VSLYMAKASTTAAAFDGSGSVWFKVADIGPTFDASGTASWSLLRRWFYFRKAFAGIVCAETPSFRILYLHNSQVCPERRLSRQDPATCHP
jgi:hypothetical protein